jgi:DNA ligase-1
LADEITRSPAHTCGKVGEQPGYGLRFPRLLEERKDKAAEDATTEQEILRLQQLQRPARVLRRGAAKR